MGCCLPPGPNAHPMGLVHPRGRLQHWAPGHACLPGPTPPARPRPPTTAPTAPRAPPVPGNCGPRRLAGAVCCLPTLNICLTLCRGKFTFSLCSSCRTSPMLRLPSPFLSASSNVCFSHFGAELGATTGPTGPECPLPPARPGRGVRLRAQGYWSLVLWRRARLSSSLMPAMR